MLINLPISYASVLAVATSFRIRIGGLREQQSVSRCRGGIESRWGEEAEAQQHKDDDGTTREAHHSHGGADGRRSEQTENSSESSPDGEGSFSFCRAMAMAMENGRLLAPRLCRWRGAMQGDTWSFFSLQRKSHLPASRREG
jgi:hypothetical protein